ncbi:MAG: haloacid dehalogenase-like hydrolase [Eubacteriales bacterium]|nr:haloacid dehalogenase-like hydrolase [Christensenellaceae bacterium]MEA5065791.1 haloacid dehalogenase-like hydrolase [Eubacteriales bacterium]
MINVYDFDRTIFDGDATARFLRYAIARHPSLAAALPRVGRAFLLYAVRRLSKTEAKQALYRAILPRIDAQALLGAFWRTNMGRVKRWYLDRRAEGDVVISASPEFLLEPACRSLGIATLIASRVDARTGDYTGENCHGEEKVRRYLDEHAVRPFAFYSDSLSDAPMARLAERAYLVKGKRVSAWPDD